MKKTLSLLLFLTSIFIIAKANIHAVDENDLSDKYITSMKEITDISAEDYKYKDWQQTTIDYLNFILDETNTFTDPRLDTGLGKRDSKIGRYAVSANASKYFNETVIGWGIPSYLGGPQQDTELGEAIAVLSAIMSGGLAGLDMTKYNAPGRGEFNYVKAALHYYNIEGLILNGGDGVMSGATFWYDLLPGVLFSVIASQYPSEQYYTYDVLANMSRGWYKAVVGLGGASADFYHLGYSILQDEVTVREGSHKEPDAAGGIAYILYSTYEALKAEGSNAYATEQEMNDFLQGAKWSMDYLDRIDFNPSYEIFQLFAPYIAAKLNVNHGTNYNVLKMFNDSIDGDSRPRTGWGMIFENFGDYYTQGLMGAQRDAGGYGFAMGTFDAMMGFAPLVKYDKRYAYDVAKWVLAASQSAQNYYPENYTLDGEYVNYGDKTVWHGANQSANMFAPNDPKASFIPYEGLRKYARYVGYNDQGQRYLESDDRSVSPYASGDSFSFNWDGRSDYGLYGASHVGTFSAIKQTNVEMILETDLDLLDVFSTTGNVSYKMYYNPLSENKTITVNIGSNTNKLFNTLTNEYLSLTLVDQNRVSFDIKAGETIVTAELPQEANLVRDGIDLKYGDIIISQDRATLTAEVLNDKQEVVAAESNVSGMLYVDLAAYIPSVVQVDSVKVSLGNKIYYNEKNLPTAKVPVDTSQTANGNTSLVVELKLIGGSIEKFTIPFRVLNIIITPAFEYEDIDDMVNQWNDATTIINATGPLADHDATASKNSNDELVLKVNQGFGFGFAASQEFYVDFTRQPLMDINVVSTTGQYAVKFNLEGKNWHVTGQYLLRDTDKVGSYSFDLLELLKLEDPTFMPVGALKASIHIGVVGTNAEVTISDLSVYHLYETPNLEEPIYEWGFTYHPAYISMWNTNQSNGAIGNPQLIYNDKGEAILSSSNEVSGIASKLIKVDNAQNPVIRVKPISLTGKYAIGLKIKGDNTLYTLTDMMSTLDSKDIVINKLMEQLYPHITIPPQTEYQIVVIADQHSSVNIGTIQTFYQLPVWGMTLVKEDWNDWERQPGYGTVGYSFDINNRLIIKNTESYLAETQLSGFRGKFTINYDYNPYLDITVRQATGQWRLVLVDMETNMRFTLKDWSNQTSRQPFHINVNEVLTQKQYGNRSVYLVIEVLGGQNEVTVEKLATNYQEISVDFGKTYTDEIASWNKGVNPSNVSILTNGTVLISQNEFNSNGIYTELIMKENLNPMIEIKVSDVKEGTTPYLKFYYENQVFTVNLEEGKDSILVNLRELIGLDINEAFNGQIEIGATGTFFSFIVESVAFDYMLAEVKNAQFSKDLNKITWLSNELADGYTYEIYQLDQLVKNGSLTSNELDLTSLNLEEGIYKVLLTSFSDEYLTSKVTSINILQGDIESVQLASVKNLKVDGKFITFDLVENALAYEVEIINFDDNKQIAKIETESNQINLTQYDLSGFNYKVNVKTIGDGLVYLDSQVVSLDFHTKEIAYYTAKSFSSMNSGNNQTSAIYNEAMGYAELKINDGSSTWGDVTTLTLSMNFNMNPVIYIDFDDSSTGGYYVHIYVDGQRYYIADDTFDFTDIYIDVKKEIASRSSNNFANITGTRNVTISFGATSNNGLDPVVRYKEAVIYEFTPGQGTPMLGTLDKPVLTRDGNAIKWHQVPNAQSYVFIVKNSLGVLIQQTVTDLTYDLSILKVEGSYEVNVVAKGNQYFDSETSVFMYEVSTLVDEPEVKNNTALFIAMSAGIPLIIGLVVLVVLKKKR